MWGIGQPTILEDLTRPGRGVGAGPTRPGRGVGPGPEQYACPVRRGGTGSTSSARRPAPATPPPPRTDRRRFKAELTPGWLHLATLLAGQPPPGHRHHIRAAYVGGGLGFTAAVVAAVHPDAHVWWWDPDVAGVEAAHRLQDRAALTNLTVHERADLPDAPGGGPLDLVVIDGVIDAVDDGLRAEVLRALLANLRPGGLACVSYRTTAGWSEVAPVHRLVRHLVARDPRPPHQSVPDALAAVEQLHAGDARYLTHRPAVDAWWRELRALGIDAASDRVRLALRPLSHAQVVDAFGRHGCTFAGPARADDLAPRRLDPALADIIDRFDAPVLHQTLADLALHRDHRVDLFRLGSAPVATRDRQRALDKVAVTGQGLLDPADPTLRRVLPVALRRALSTGTVSVGDLADRAVDREELVRTLLARGLVHPIPGDVDPRATDAARRLTALINRAPVPVPHRMRVVPGLASALPAAAALDADQQTSLGIR